MQRSVLRREAAQMQSWPYLQEALIVLDMLSATAPPVYQSAKDYFLSQMAAQVCRCIHHICFHSLSHRLFIGTLSSRTCPRWPTHACAMQCDVAPPGRRSRRGCGLVKISAFLTSSGPWPRNPSVRMCVGPAQGDDTAHPPPCGRWRRLARE